ncbi:MAG: DUF4190 domain-containing protein [Ruminococcaceae bacterium]|nr:DUF4190 domain-containing protein [Oscillospiraceae bacterium]
MDEAVICPHCGCATRIGAPHVEEQKTNIFALVGFILSFFFALAGLILSIIGYKKAPEYNNSGKGLALAGIIISSATMVLAIIYSIFYIILITGVAGVTITALIH